MSTTHTNDDRTGHSSHTQAYERAMVYPGLLRRISWSAILAGAVLALALQFVFALLGTAIGFSLINPLESGDSGPIGIGAIVYTVLSQIISLVAGGFIAARMAGIPRDTTAGIHGVMVWATSTFAMAYIAATAGAAVLGGTASLLGNVAQGTTNAVEAALPEDLPSVTLPELEMQDLPEPVRRAIRENDFTVEQIRGRVDEIYNEVISEEEERAARDTARSLARDIAQSPGDVREDIDQAIDRLFGEGEPLSSRERNELISAVSDELNFSERRAEQLVSELEEAAEEAVQSVEEAAAAAREEALETADEAADAAASAMFWLFVFSVLGLVAALFGGIVGKPDDRADALV